MKNKIIIMGMSLLISLASLANEKKILLDEGGLVGNGGGTVVCKNEQQKITSVELLDYYEVYQHEGMTLEIDEIKGNWKEKVAALIERVHLMSDFRYQLYQDWFKTFESETKMLRNVQMSTIPDSGYIVVPKGCAYEQALIQRTPIFAKDARYFVNADLWDLMNESQRAGLVMHELVYREALAYGHTDSIRVRYLNALYATKEYLKISFMQYVKVIERSHFELTDLPLSMDKNVTLVTNMNLTRFPQTSLSRINGRVLGMVGECSGEGCKVFEPLLKTYSCQDDNASYCWEYPGIRIAPDVTSIQLGGVTVFGNHKSLFVYPIRQGSMFIGLHLHSEKEQFLVTKDGFLMSGSMLGLALDNRTNEFNWQFARLEWLQKLDDRTNPPPGEPQFYDPVLSVNGKCNYIETDFSKGQVIPLYFGKKWDCIPTDNQGGIQVFNKIKNGTYEIFLKSDLLWKYDLDKMKLANDWKGPWKSWKPLFVSSFIENHNANRNYGFSPVFKEEKLVALDFLDEAIYTYAGDTARFVIKYRQVVDLYPNGQVKSFITKGHVSIRYPQEMIIRSESRIHFDDKGNITKVDPPAQS